MRLVAIVACGLLCTCGGGGGKPIAGNPAAGPAQPAPTCQGGGVTGDIGELLRSTSWCTRDHAGPTGETWSSAYTFAEDGTFRREIAKQTDPGGFITRNVTSQGGVLATGCWKVEDGKASISSDGETWTEIEVGDDRRLTIGGVALAPCAPRQLTGITR